MIFIPPMPCSQESVSIMMSGIRRVMRFRLIPKDACFRNFCHNSRSSLWSWVKTTDRLRLARYIAVRMRPRKWRAVGIMNPAWLRRPRSISNVPWLARGEASKSVMLWDHAINLCSGRDINKRRVSMTQPNTVLISDGGFGQELFQ